MKSHIEILRQKISDSIQGIDEETFYKECFIECIVFDYVKTLESFEKKQLITDYGLTRALHELSETCNLNHIGNFEHALSVTVLHNQLDSRYENYQK
jgi:hypothetical protein